VMMRHNTDRNAELADMLITPDVSGYGFTDFDAADELGRIGYDATAELAEQIDQYALDESEWDAYLQARAQRRRFFEATPEFLEVSGATEVDEPAVEATLEHHLGVPLDVDDLDFDLTNITGWGRYNVAGYEGRERADTEGLGVDLHEKTSPSVAGSHSSMWPVAIASGASTPPTARARRLPRSYSCG